MSAQPGTNTQQPEGQGPTPDFPTDGAAGHVPTASEGQDSLHEVHNENTGTQAPTNPEVTEHIEAVQPIEVDFASDSGYGDSDSDSYASSLLSGVTNYQYENGRRYHGYREGIYLLPNDEKESDRLDIYHHLMGIVNGGRLHRAPIQTPQRILDIGTGTGIWAIQMGDEYPSAEVLGVDISPTQPTWVPPNVVFEVEDVENDWTWRHPFDFIHCRYMPACIADFKKLVKQAYDHTSSGGWVEFEDWDLNLYSTDGTLTPEHAFKRLHTLFIEACEVMGRVASPGQHLKRWFEEAGFVNITHLVVKLPFGTWPRDRALVSQTCQIPGWLLRES